MIDRLAELRKEILSIYPIDSRWYDPAQDDVVTIVAHFEPRGVIARQEGPSRPGSPSYTYYGYGELVDGSLMAPRDGGWVEEFKASRDAQLAELEKLQESLPKGSFWK